MATFNEFALARLIISTFLFIVQMLTTRLFLVHPEFWFTCFRMMLYIAICDAIEQFIQGILPIFICFYNIFENWKWLEKIFGALNQSAYTSLFLLNLILAINRLCVVIKLQILKEYGDGETSWEKWLNKVLYFFVGAYFFGVLALFCSPYLGTRFAIEYFTWTNDMNATWMEAESAFEMNYFNNILPATTMAIYLAAFGIMKINNNDPIMENIHSFAARQKATQNRILLQCAVQFVVFQLPGIYFMIARVISVGQPPLWSARFQEPCYGWNPGKTSLQRTGIVSILMVLICGVNPFIYLAMLPTFRQKFIDDFRAIFKLKDGAQMANLTMVAPLNTKNGANIAGTTTMMLR